MGCNAQVLDPGVAAVRHGRRPRPRGRGLVVVGILAILFSSDGGPLWSVRSEYGGTDAAGGWIDDVGRPTTSPPIAVSVEGHTAPVALVALLLVVVAGVVVPRMLDRVGRQSLGDVVRRGAYVAAPVCIVLGVLVYTVWQGHVVMDQIDHRVIPVQGFPGGGTSIETSTLRR